MPLSLHYHTTPPPIHYSEDDDGVPEDGHGEHGGVSYKPPLLPLCLFLLPAGDSMYLP